MGAAYIKATSAFEETLSNSLASLGTVVVRKPRATLAIWFAVIIAAMSGFVRFDMESAAEKLWVDQNSEAMKNENYIEDFLEEHRGARPALSGNLMYVVEKDAVGEGDVLTKAAVDEIWDVHEILISTVDIEHETGLKFTDICDRNRNANGECWYGGLLQFWYGNRTLYEEEITNDDDLKTAVAAEFYPDFSRVNREFNFPRYTIAGGKISSPHVIMLYVVESTFEGEEAGPSSWMRHVFVDTIVSTNDDSTLIESWAQADNSVDDELSASVGNDVSLMMAAFLLMIGFITLVLGRPGNRLEGRALLAQQTVGMVFFSAGGGYGFAMLCGVKFTTLAQILPFILLGIGVDDALVLVGAFDRTNHEDTIENRMAETMRREGVSITVTSLTDIVALLLGATTRLPAVSYFCFYAALSILFIYASFITCFVALLTFDERRRFANRSDPFPICMGPARDPANFDYATITRSKTLDDRVGEFLKEKYSVCLLNKYSKIGVLVFFALLTGLGVYGATQITTQFELGDLVNDSSPVKTALDVANMAYSGSPFPPVVPRLYTLEQYPLHTAGGQSQYLALLSELRASDVIDETRPVSFWFDDFNTWAATAYPAEVSNGRLTAASPNAYGVRVREWFETPPFDKIYNETVWFSLDSDAVALTNVAVPMPIALTKTEEQGAALRTIEGIVDKYEYGRAGLVFVSHDAFTFFDQYAIIVREAVVNLALATAAIGAISLIFLVHPAATLIVGGTLGMILVDVIGSFQLWGLDLNSISTVNLVLAIGLVVDPIAHVSHSFITQPHELSRDDKMRATFGDIGSAVFLGVMSTILGIAPIALASSQVFRVFFFILFSSVFLGLVHGLIFLPVVLSLVGPTVERAATQRKDVLVPSKA